jgi:hypothetical protein
MKPIKHSIKVFVLACAVTSYVWNFDIYTGKDTYKYGSNEADIVIEGLMSENVREMGRSAAQDTTVLVDTSAANKFSTLYVDNWYTTQELMKGLWDTYNMFTVGTYSLTSKKSRTKDDYPFAKLSGRASASVPGGWMRRATKAMIGYPIYQAVIWKDKKLVGFLMNKFVGAAKVGCSVERRRRGQSVAVVPAHQGIKSYQQFYSGVDRADRGMADWTVERASGRWYMRLFYYSLNVMVLNMWIIVSFWVKGKAAGSAAYSEPAKRHGERMTFVMRLAQNVICYAVRSQVADLDGVDDPRGRWIGNAKTLEELLTTVWHEQDISEANSGGASGRSDVSGARSRENTHREVHNRKPCVLARVRTAKRHCQVCYKLAPPPPPGHISLKWKLKHCVYKGVKYDKKCKLRMCPKCYATCWNHVANTQSLDAKSHCCRRA